jgi:hypothetical protein
VITKPQAGRARWYWLALIVLGFGIREAIAIAKHHENDTFSFAMQTWVATWHPERRFRKARLVSFLLFWIALGVHVAWGMRAWPGLIVPSVPLTVFVVLSNFVWKER